MKRSTHLPLLLCFTAAMSCVVQADPLPGPPGPKGEDGEPGKDGDPGGTKLTELEAKLEQLQLQLDAIRLTAEVAECPYGYAKVDATLPAFLSETIVCARDGDEVVRVGTGATRFWIDRYEASVWTSLDGPVTGAQKFAGADDSAPEYPKTGQSTISYYALSIPGVTPANRMTWFQAMEACGAAGKRLPTRQEWIRAARGTFDPPGNSDGHLSKQCNNMSSSLRDTGGGLGASLQESCISDWGVEDMIGNLWEWTDEWYAGLYDDPASAGMNAYWPNGDLADFKDDIVANISSWARCDDATFSQGLPAAALRGGDFASGKVSGIFSLALGNCPVAASAWVGFRCVIGP